MTARRPINRGTPPATATPALEIGGTHVAGALIDLDARRVVAGSQVRIHLRPDGEATEILDSILDCARALPPVASTTWAVAAPGPMDYRRGIGRYEGVAKFEALNGVDIRAALLAGLATSATEISFVNDAEAFAIGEWAAGAAAGHDRVAGITLGTGVGSAFLDRGAVVSDGPLVPPNGRVHLLEIDGRPLEETVSRRAILARYEALRTADAPGSADGHHATDVRELADLARGGDADAAAAIDDALEALGLALGPWLARFGATVFVVGGSMAGSWDLVEPPLVRGLASGTPGPMGSVAVMAAAHPGEAGLVGAALHARAALQAGLTETEPASSEPASP